MDCRDFEKLTESIFIAIDERRMIGTVRLWDENDGYIEEDVEVPIIYKVCGLCNGRGSYINPSIDSHGLTSDDFAEDPDFAEEYFSNRYDVICHRCNGKRVEPIIDEQHCDKSIVKRIVELREANYQEALERANQIRYGY